MKPVLLWSDALLFLLMAGVLVLVWSMRHEDWLRDPWRHVMRSRIGAGSALLLVVFLAVGLLDSLHYRERLPREAGPPGATAQHSGEVLSALDWLLTDLRTRTEKTYSAPLATHLYVKESMKGPDGREVRDYPPLQYPRGHLLGTDKVGQDVLYLSLKSIRTGLLIGSLTTLVMLPFAITLGMAAGYFGGRVDDLIQYVYTTINSIPGVLLIAAAVLVVQAQIEAHPELFDTAAARADVRLLALCAILGITGWTGLARLLRGEVLKLREMEFVQAARAFGVGRLAILSRHLLPNVMHLVLITVVIDFSGLVLAEAVLSYVGVGVDPAMNSFGNMINGARLELAREPVVWWQLAAAFVFMFVLVLAANLFADQVRDALDPRMERKS
ncbi:MAG TPA: ABC transporter permease [Thiobacillaceae bacterium]|nr:ABC transporter permease [Thiobacillaceae bacterium]HNU62956.1 ABC transporter permease [Thiobacillaceae bacterium]